LSGSILVYVTCCVGCMHRNQSFYASGSVVFVNFDKVEVWRCVAFQCGTPVARPRRMPKTGNTCSSHVPIIVLSLVRALSFLVPTSKDLLCCLGCHCSRQIYRTSSSSLCVSTFSIGHLNVLRLLPSKKVWQGSGDFQVLKRNFSLAYQLDWTIADYVDVPCQQR
jgi:hypothetical protein